MSFLKRFRSYFIGFGIGIIMVMFIFRDRANLFTSWLPENRVLIELYQDSVITTPLTECQLACLGTNLSEFKEGLKENTSVEFSKSKPQQKPREYCLVQNVKGSPTTIIVETKDSITTVTAVIVPAGVKCDCK